MVKARARRGHKEGSYKVLANKPCLRSLTGIIFPPENQKNNIDFIKIVMLCHVVFERRTFKHPSFLGFWVSICQISGAEPYQPNCGP